MLAGDLVFGIPQVLARLSRSACMLAASGELKVRLDSEVFGSALPCFGEAQTDIKTLESLLLFLAEAVSFPFSCSWSELV